MGRGAVHQETDAAQMEWVSLVMDVLGDHLRDNLVDGGTLTYGSDCSGIDSPLWALSQLVEGLQVWSAVRATKYERYVYSYTVIQLYSYKVISYTDYRLIYSTY